MKSKEIFLALSLIVSVGLLTQCEKYGDRGGMPEPDPDSDRPEWAGGNTDANDHNKKGDSGGNPGVEYGDQIMLDRDGNGVPILYHLLVEGAEETVDEWIVRPVDVNGDWLEIDEENVETAGELLEGEDPVEIDFGRLNIVKSPESVLNQALIEAMNTLNPDKSPDPELIDVDIRLDFCGRLSAYTLGDDGVGGDGELIKTIDSPRENMAIYKEIMNNMFEGELTFLQAFPDLDPLNVAASCFAAGSDKTGFVDKDEVVYINGIMGCYGLAPIENCQPYVNWYTQDPDAEELNRDGTVRQYFDFGQSGVSGGPAYTYDRSVYLDRYILFKVWDGAYHDEDSDHQHIYSINDIMEGLVTYLGPEEEPSFSRNLDPEATAVELFAQAVDDAVQVLEFVHGDSNIEFLPDYEP